MRKLFFVFAVAGLLTACKSKKADEKKADEAVSSTTTTTTEPATTTTTTTTEPVTTSTSMEDVPKFSDPEVQKFADDYFTFIKAYKGAMTDPVKAQEYAMKMKDWSTRTTAIAMKLAGNPAEAQKWALWAAAVSKQLMSAPK